MFYISDRFQLSVHKFLLISVIGISAKGHISVDDKNELVAVMFQIVLLSPEMLFISQCWRVMLTSETYSSRIRAHICKQWYVNKFHGQNNV